MWNHSDPFDPLSCRFLQFSATSLMALLSLFQLWHIKCFMCLREGRRCKWLLSAWLNESYVNFRAPILSSFCLYLSLSCKNCSSPEVFRFVSWKSILEHHSHGNEGMSRPCFPSRHFKHRTTKSFLGEIIWANEILPSKTNAFKSRRVSGWCLSKCKDCWEMFLPSCNCFSDGHLLSLHAGSCSFVNQLRVSLR